MIGSRGITINKTNPDPEDFDMNRLINQIHKHISQSNKEKSRNKKAKKQNKRTRKQNKRTKEQVCKRIIKLCV